MNNCIECGKEIDDYTVLCDDCFDKPLTGIDPRFENPEMWDDWSGSDWKLQQTDAPKKDWLEGRSQLHKPF
jgi:hypothetical protein